MNRAVLALAPVLLGLITGASADGITPDQYQVGPQHICLNLDGTWYGTTFNFRGHWTNIPNFGKDRAVIYGNYGVASHPSGYGNDAMTVIKAGPEFGVNWYDWYDDFSYQNYISGTSFTKDKSKCDPPFTDKNTHAATQ
jgi:hypothetical protein